MRIVVNLTEDSADVLAEFSAGAKLYLLSSSSESGSYSDVTSTTIVSGTEQYELTDSAGTSSTWYKTQVGNSAGSTRGSLSDAFRATSLVAYATLDDLRETLALGANTTHDNLLYDLLIDVSADLDAICQRRFYRDPQVSGTTTVYADVWHPGCRSLEEAIGRAAFVDGRALDIVSVTSLSVRDTESSEYAEVPAGDTGYYLDGWAVGVGVYGTDWPYEDVTLSPASTTYTVFPTGRRAVKITGVFGFPTVPNPVKRAVITEAAERFRQKIGGGQAPAGVNQFGTPIFLTGDSPDFRRVTRAPFSRRAMAA